MNDYLNHPHLYEYLSFLLILLICAVVFQMTYEIVRMPHSIYYCLVKKFCYNDSKSFDWLMKNKYYIYLHPMVFFMSYSAVIKASQLDMGISHIRPLWDIASWIVILTCGIFHMFYTYKNLRK